MVAENFENGSVSSNNRPTKIGYYSISLLDEKSFWDQFRSFIKSIENTVQNSENLSFFGKQIPKKELTWKPEQLHWNGGHKFLVVEDSNDAINDTKECEKPKIFSIDDIVKVKTGASSELSFANHVRNFVVELFSEKEVFNFLALMSTVNPFSEDFSDIVTTHDLVNDEPSRGLDILALLKKLKYFLNFTIGQVLQLLSQLSTHAVFCEAQVIESSSNNQWIFKFASLVTELQRCECESVNYLMKMNFKSWAASQTKTELKQYQKLELKLEKADPHSIFPTSIYRRCNGQTYASSDAQTIEAIMETVLTTTIKITRNVLDPRVNQLLADVYRPLGRVVAIVDDKVDEFGYSDQIRKYFAYFAIECTLLVFGGNEIDKDMSTVQNMLVALKKNNVSRNCPVLVVGGGVISDTAGLACSLYHRNTPYVMLATSIVSGIDAGPSPRTCCDGFGYKNLYGAYHPPVLTLTDRMFWKSLKTGWVRHGFAEIVKMACVKDLKAFELLEKAGSLLVKTKFGTEMTSSEFTQSKLEAELQKRGFAGEQDFQDACDEIVGRAMEGYVRSEYGNLWETHQARPHAFGHTWSPGYELPAGLLHGHAVSSCMGFGAFLARYHGECQKIDDVQQPWLSEEAMMRILHLISELELTLYHPIMDKVDIIWAAQLKMTAKRGGNLAAPVPKGEIGNCGYIKSLDEQELRDSLRAYKELITGSDANGKPRFARNGFGVDMHCHDVGLQDPSTVIKPNDLHVGSNRKDGKSLAHQPAKVQAPDAEKIENKVKENNREISSQPSTYHDWIAEMQTKRHKNPTKTIHEQFEPASDYHLAQFEENNPPAFPHLRLFADETAEKYALKRTTSCSENLRIAAQITEKESLFLPCMIGPLESQFLKMIASMSNSKRVLDVGTFTGMSAIAFAETGAEVVTLELDKKIAKVAQTIFDKIDKNVGQRINLQVGNANQLMRQMALKGEKFDLIFLDADIDNYQLYYDIAMDGGLLAGGGSILVDNSAGALLYDESDERRNTLHRFNQKVADDDRVEQVLLTIREGLTIIRQKQDMMVFGISDYSKEKTENQHVQSIEKFTE